MSESLLVPCAACSRHLRSSESRCVFCGAAVSARTRVAQPAAPKGASRAAVFAFRAALLASAGTGCSSAHSGAADGGGHSHAGTPSLPHEGGSTAGAVSFPLAGGAATAGTAGAPHAGSGATAGTSRDAGAPLAGAIALPQPDAAVLPSDDAGFIPIPLYGGAFPDPKTRARV